MEQTNKEKKIWRYCVVGNIVKTHYDNNGILRYGTPAFRGGTKVYLCGKIWFEYNYEFNKETIQALGLSRGKQYYVEDVPLHLIENVRCSKTYKPAIVNIMGDWESAHCWWTNTEEDKLATESFVAKWNFLFAQSSQNSEISENKKSGQCFYIPNVDI